MSAPGTVEYAARVSHEVRSRRAALRVELRNRSTSIPDLLREDPLPWMEGMRVDKLLRSMPAVGEEKAFWICHDAKVPPHRRLGTLTPGQRTRLIASFEDRCSILAGKR